MKKMNKLLSLLLAMVMALSLALPAFAEGDLLISPAPTDAPKFNGEIVILHTNDVHGGVDGYAKVAALKAKYQAEGAYVLVMDAGDFAQGDSYVNLTKGMNAVKFMNSVGYDVIACGNHEFDFGIDNLHELIEASECPILGANVTLNGKKLFEKDNLIFEAPNGYKIGVFGIVTPETATKCNPKNLAGVKFAASQEMYDIAQKQVDALKAEKCDFILCLAHLGIADETAAGKNRSIDLLENVNGIDLLIDGHSHSTEEQIVEKTNADRTVNGAVLTSTGTKLKEIGVVSIKDGKFTTGCVDAKEIEVPEGDATAALVAAEKKVIDDEMNVKFAVSEVDLGGNKAVTRTAENNMGDMICDAMLWKAQKEDIKVDVAISNGGGMRAPISKGDITKKDINNVLPFSNIMTVVQITGEQLLEALEAGTNSTPDPIGAFPQVAGVEYTINTLKKYDQGEQYPDSTYYAPKSIQRVSIQTVGGKPFDPKATYSVMVNDFMANGGDTYYVLKLATSVVDLGFRLDNVVMEYISEGLNGVIPAEKYAETQGRITIKGYKDVTANNWFVDAVAFADEKGLMDGFDGKFLPEDDMTREMLVTALYRLEGSPEVKAENKFTDVAADAAYLNAVLWASENGVVEGFEDGTFRPDASITREQMAALLYRYAKAEKVEADFSKFTDADKIQDWAKEAMNWVVANEIISGMTETTLVPAGTATRAQVATILMRFVNIPAAEELPAAA